MPLETPGESSETTDWLSRQLGRLVDHEADRSPQGSEGFMSKKEARLEILTRISRAQQALSDTQAALGTQRWRHAKLLGKLSGSQLELEAKKRQLDYLIEHPDDFRVRDEREGSGIVHVVSMPDPWSEDLLSQREAFLGSEKARMHEEFFAFQRTLQEDSCVRLEERVLREHAQKGRREAAYNKLRNLEISKSEPLEQFLQLRFRLCELSKRKEASEKVIREETASLSSQIHELADRARQAAEQQVNLRVKAESSISDAFALEEGRLLEKIQLIERKIAQLTQSSSESAKLLTKERNKFCEQFKAAEIKRRGNSDFERVREEISSIKNSVKRLEDITNALRAKAREDDRLARE